MTKKKWYQSKTKWGAILMAAGAVGAYLAGQLDINSCIMQVTAALSVFGIRDAMK
jgi:hypothetical protein